MERRLGHRGLRSLTVSGATRVALLASSVEVRVANLLAREHRVSATLADGYAPTRNALVVLGPVTPDAPLQALVPPFAQSCRGEFADAGLLTGASLSLVDATARPLAQLPLSLLPANGLVVAGAHAAQLLGVRAPCLGRLVFSLAL